MSGAVRISILAASAPLAGFLLGVSLFFVWNYVQLFTASVALPLGDVAVGSFGLVGAIWLAPFLAWRPRLGAMTQVLLLTLFGCVTAIFAWLSLVSHQSY